MLLPREENRLRSKLTGKRCYYRFESEPDGPRLDTKRREAAARLLAEGCDLIDKILAQALIKTLSYDEDEPPPESRACATYMRDLRRRLCGEILRLRRRSYPGMKGVHLLSWKWDVAPDKLTPYRLRRIIKELGNYLDRIEFRGAKGFFIAGLDGEYNALRGVFRIHFHCVACGDYPKLISTHLRPKAAFAPVGAGYAPIQICEIDGPASQVSYITKSYWNYRTARKNKAGILVDGLKSSLMPEPYNSLYMTNINALSVGETYVMRGIYTKRGRLIVRNP